MRTIAHISDLHFGRLDPPVAEALVEDFQRTPPSLLVISGDFTQRAGAGQYAQAAEYLKRLPMPRIVVPGNHDVPMYNVVRRFFFPLGRYLKFITTDLSPVFQDEEMFVMGVNSARSLTQKSGWLSEKQLADIRDQFCAVPDGKIKVLVTHHPFIPAPHEPHGDIIRGAPKILEQLESCSIDVLLAGHLHFAYHGDVRTHHTTARQSILSIQAGTATSTRRRGEANAYNWITLNPKSVNVEVRSWDGNAFAPKLTTHFRRIDETWTRDA